MPTKTESFSAREFMRYSRHIQLPQAGTRGQLALKASRVTLVGCGGLGAPASLYLAAAGVGHIRLIDGDHVELSNLQRQITFSESQLGTDKTSSTADRLSALNSDIEIETINEHLQPDNADRCLAGSDLILDCTDNFAARYLINDVASEREIPWIYASIHQFSGQIALFKPGGSCFRCLFPTAPKDAPDCNAAGVLGVLPGLLGSLQAAEALKYILGLPGLADRLMLVETLDMSFRQIGLKRSKDCACCNGEASFDPNNSDYVVSCSSTALESHELSSTEFRARSLEPNTRLVDVRDKGEHTSFNIGGESVPLAQLAAFLEAIPEGSGSLLFYCHSGKRSLNACQMAQAAGNTAHSLSGGLQQLLKDESG